MTRFGFAAVSSKLKGDTNWTVTLAGVVVATSLDEAEGKAKLIGEARFPVKQGWTAPYTTAFPFDKTPIEPHHVSPYEL